MLGNANGSQSSNFLEHTNLGLLTKCYIGKGQLTSLVHEKKLKIISTKDQLKHNLDPIENVTVPTSSRYMSSY